MVIGTTRGLGNALASLVGDVPDVLDVIARLVTDCAGATGAAAVAVLAREDGDELSMLAATSHRATEIEMLQAHQSNGPCVEAIMTGKVVRSVGEAEILKRWGEVGQAIVVAGFRGVESYPMAWRGQSLGGLNLFWSSPTGSAPAGVGQAYADMATLIIVHASALVTHDGVQERLHEALHARAVVEQAKGVIAYLQNVDMEVAYDMLILLAAASDAGLTEVARDVVRRRAVG